MEVWCESDWCGSRGDRKSTSGGVILMGGHCIKTWSATQGEVALSSADAEFYAMVEGALRLKDLVTLAKELGFKEISRVLRMATDSNAAKSFVARRGLGKMQYLEVKDLWLQREVLEGKILVKKVKGTENMADLMTKFLNKEEIRDRLRGAGLVA